MNTLELIKEKILNGVTMKAVQIHTYGGPEVLSYDDVHRPRPGKGEILVRVCAAGVNPIDWKVRQGYFKNMVNYKLPLILGWDFSGVVHADGYMDSRFKIGDKVYGRADITRNGTYAEYLVVRESEIAFKPKSINHIHAAAIPIAGLTAWQSLFDIAALSAGQKVLIHAAAGGVGSFAVQLAKWNHAYVIGTASNLNKDFVLALGADEVIDYQATRFEDVVSDVDVVLDTVGGDTQKRSWKVLRKNGILVSIVSSPAVEDAVEYGMRRAYVRGQANPAQLHELAKLVDEGKIRPVVEIVLPLSEARRAHQLIEAGHVRGKIVLLIEK